MARPFKEGLDYFPLDVDVDQDDKIALIEATHGVEGFGIIVKLLMKIYDNSYFYQWGLKEQLLFSKKVNVDINRVNDIINDCLKWGFFSEEMHENHAILTSRGIQRRYLEACNRRKTVKMDAKYTLINNNEVNVYKNLIIDDLTRVNDDIGTQRKGEERKGSSSEKNPFKFFENNYGTLTPFVSENIQMWCEDLSDDLVVESMKMALKSNKPFNYAEGILKQWYKNNIKSLDDVQTEKVTFEKNKNQKRAQTADDIDWDNI